MIPLRHTQPLTSKPVVNRALVTANILCFVAQIIMGARTEQVINVFGFIPARLVHPAAYGYTAFQVAITLVASLFLHGGFVHLTGNMIYLAVFGGAVEDALGHFRFLLFYIFCGVFGSVTHTLLFPMSTVPSIGASGSIAGVLGAFLVLHPGARIVTLFPLIVYWAMAEIRAALFLPVWFALQFFNGFMALASAARTQEVAGIAWWAHIGGFLLGACVGLVIRVARRGAVAS